MTTALDLLRDLLDLEKLEENLFRGRSPQENRQRVFGGQVAAQSLVAAGRTTDRTLHSLHAYFLRPGDPRIPILYEVDRLRDGRTFVTRRVTGIQHGRPIFALSASFQTPEAGLEHQAAMPDVPAPEQLPDFEERVKAAAERVPEGYFEAMKHRELAIDTRPADGTDFWTRQTAEPRNLSWMRTRGPLPDELLLHQCVATCASDLTILETAIRPHPHTILSRRLRSASLDHAMWFHRPFRADQWLLYDQESPSMSSARAFTTGRLFARDGTLVASVVQEGFLRILPKDADAS